MKHVGTAHLQLAERSTGRFLLSKGISNLEIDLSALAKGYAIDQLAEYLSERGFDNYLIDLGGELRARGTSANGEAWQVGLEQPDIRSIGEIRSAIALKDSAIATSGGYRNFMRDTKGDGRSHSHIIDPRTGRPVAHNLVSVSVIDSTAMRADAWATALIVLEPDEGYELAMKRRMAATFVVKTADRLTERATEAFEKCGSHSRTLESRAK